VAGILHVDEKDGVIVVEDLGDILLEDIAGRPEFPRHLYEAAVDTLLAIQVRSRGREAGWPAIFGRAIDAEKIAFELDHLKRHGLERGRGLSASEARAVDRAFALIIDEVAALPRVLNHRDYHSRNIMVTAGRIAIVDHQDALMASPFYDLASLLHDSYVALPRDALEALRAGYLDEARFAGLPVPESDELAFKQFDIVALQRNAKALGTFAYQGHVRGREYFLESIPKTLSDIRGNPAAARPELAPLAGLLEDRLGGPA
jgi:aminoglycoside/choline kinase family phosphotransferase